MSTPDTEAAPDLRRLADTDLCTDAHGAEVGLSAEEMERARTILGRVPNKVELGCFSAMWSEHCSYKSSRLHLGRLPSDGERVVVGPGENAGVVRVDDERVIVFKVESHNHPSFIEPYQGAATGVGGILRDVFTMGARPIAAANLFRFGTAQHARTPHLVRGVVRGVGDYGNCFGVPTVWTDLRFDASYDGNILVNAFALGVAHKDRIFLGRAEGVGNPVFYVGAKTGRDGIHGATMASDSFSEHEEAERPTVQVGDPFKEKLLLEACLECFQTSALVGIQDMGAAGLTSSSFEMASRTGAGLWLDLDAVPTREEGMTAYELMLSESQERMLLVAEKGREDEVKAIYARWDLDCVEVGKVTDDGQVRIQFGGREVAAVPARPLADEAPKYDRPQRDQPPTVVDERVARLGDVPIESTVNRLTSDPGLTSRRWIYEQFDRHVLVGTLEDGMSAAAAVVEVPDCPQAVALSLVSADHVGAGDAYEGGVRSVAEGALRAACTGASPIACSDCLNYGNPEDPAIMRELASGIDGIAEACRVLDVPVISGNVSLYNETDQRSIHPTPALAVVGLLEDAQVRASYRVPPGSALVLLGGAPSEPGSGTAAGVAGPALTGAEALRGLGPVPRGGAGAEARWDLAEVSALVRLCVGAVEAGIVRAARPVVGGGFTSAIVEMMLASSTGLMVSLADDPRPLDVVLFGEGQPRVLAALAHDRLDALKQMAASGNGSPVAVREIGGARGTDLVIELADQTLQRTREQLTEAWEGSLPHVASGRIGNA